MGVALGVVDGEARDGDDDALDDGVPAIVDGGGDGGVVRFDGVVVVPDRGVVICAAGVDAEADADAESEAVADGVAGSSRSVGLEPSVADALALVAPVALAAGVVAGACEPSIMYSSTPTAAAAVANPAGSTHLRPPAEPPRLPACGKPSSSNRPARSAIRSANAAPAGSRRLSNTRDRTPGGMKECGNSSKSRSGRRVRTVALQIVHFSMCRVADWIHASTPRPSS